MDAERRTLHNGDLHNGRPRKDREGLLYNRIIELSEVAVDCCITKTPCGGDKVGRSPVDRGKRGTKRSVAVDGQGIPLGVVTALTNRYDSPLLAETLSIIRVETENGMEELAP